MKNKFGCDWYSMNNFSDNKMLKVSLDDNGHWGYTRWGIGMNKGEVFIVDLDDSGETWREMWYCDDVCSVEEVVRIGIKCGVIKKYDDGELYCEWESTVEDNEKFDKMVGKRVVCGELYSFIGKK
jgi:hypothetical protein